MKIIVTHIFLLLATLFLGNIAKGELSAKDVSDGPCLVLTELLPDLMQQMDMEQVIPPGMFYVPMGSKAMYRHYAEALLGRNAKTQNELDSMQLTIQSGPLLSVQISKGFPKEENPPVFGQACLASGIGSIPYLGLLNGDVNNDYINGMCLGSPGRYPNGTIALVASESFVAVMYGVVWTSEDSKIAMVYRCPTDNIKDFAVLSMNMTLPESAIAEITEKVEELGFNPANIANMEYE